MPNLTLEEFESIFEPVPQSSQEDKRTMLDNYNDLVRNDDEPLGFGKYRGKTLTQVLTIDPGYLVWIHDQTERDIVSADLYQQARKLYVTRK